jgi:hypothetical protein
MDETAKDAKIQINEPVMGIAKGFVVLRPVPLLKVEGLLQSKNIEKLKSLVDILVFGTIR